MVTALLILTALTTSGPNADNVAKADKVRCEIQIIHATRGKKHVAPELKPIANYLRNSFGNSYHRFVQQSRGGFTLKQRKSGTQTLPNGTQLKLTYLGPDKSLLRLVMEVGGLKTTVKIHDGGLFFQAGRRYKNGMLIVAIRARKIK